MNTVQYNVNGLLNTQIKTQLKHVLNDVDGVHKVNINVAQSSVEVEYKEPASEKAIQDCIEHVGCRVE